MGIVALFMFIYVTYRLAEYYTFVIVVELAEVAIPAECAHTPLR
jgi:hypothetical protein